MIRIVDYGMGNLRSVQKAFEKLGVAAEIVTTPEQIACADKLVLPGVGAFRDAIHELERLQLVESIREHIRCDKPFLGICLGLQLLFMGVLGEYLGKLFMAHSGLPPYVEKKEAVPLV